MEIQLIKGQFTKAEATDLLTKMYRVKIEFQENKINSSHHEEDIKMREGRIKELQNALAETRKYIHEHDTISIESSIHLSA